MEGTGIIGKNLRMGPVPHVSTIGWSDCGCGAGWDAGVVLDPFTGSGTALVVAKRLGRHYLGVDVVPEYVEMARARLSKIPEYVEMARARLSKIPERLDKF